MKFVLPIPPKPWQRMRGGRFRYKSDTQVRNEEEIGWALLKHRPKEPIEGPIKLIFTAFMPIPKSGSKKKREALKSQPHIKKLDLDNLAKNLKDRLTDMRFWLDDSQVWALDAQKIYDDGDGPRWEVHINYLTEEK